ncbi:MAG: class I SAM-dependent methyltransferase [Acidimicrobiales bacterium]
MADGAPSDRDEPLRYVDEIAARATGFGSGSFAPPESPTESPTIDEVRRHVDEAWAVSGAGTHLPADARMRQVKRAILLAMRPVTSHQVPFNRELAVAVQGLVGALAHLEARIDGGERAIETASSRLQASVATAELTIDDLADTVSHLTDAVEQLLGRTDDLEQRLSAERAVIRGLRGRQDLVLRAARASFGNGPPERSEVIATLLDRSTEELEAELADAIRGTRDEVRAEVEAFVADVMAIGAIAPVVDLGCGRGEWLEVLRDHGVEAYGVDTSQRAASAAVDRGLDVRVGDGAAHLAGLAESSLAAVTAFHLIERLDSGSLVDLVDRALVALRPGGLLILATANPTALDVGAAELWLDPGARRPVHPRLLELLVLARGFTEAEVRWLRPVDPVTELRMEDFAGVADVRAAALVDRLNRVLAGPRAYALVARKPGATPVEPA